MYSPGMVLTFMVHVQYGRALGTFGEHRRSPNAPKCIEMHLGAFGERVCSPNVPYALP